MISVSHPSEWDSVVRQVRTRVVRCPDCGFMRRESVHPHAPLWRGSVQFDCAGRPVTP